MGNFWEVMSAPMAACVLLVLIHASLGRHVLARGVVFVDLALAQVAALGAVVGFLFGVEFSEFRSYLWSFGFTLLGAALFSFFWDRKQSVLQEAFIGIVFSLANALVVVLLANAPHGPEHLQGLLSGGGLLWVSWKDVGIMAALYGVVGLFLYMYRGKLWLCSRDPKGAERGGMPVHGWDFLFYAAFGLVVTSSVKVAGVLAVFAFLIVPVVCATLLGKKGRSQLFWAWGIGLAGSALSVVLSYNMDWPTGATVVCVLGVAVSLVSVLNRLGIGAPGR